MLVRGKRFFKFLIHSNLLDSKYLAPHTDVMLRFIEQEDKNACGGEPLGVEQACRIYVTHLVDETRLRDEAIRTNYYCISSFTRFIGAEKNIKLIKRDNILRYLNHLEVTHGYSQRSKAAVLTCIRRFFAFFTAQGLVSANPTANIRIKKVKKVVKPHSVKKS